jgi:RNA polymerase sigma-70 factor (ECF subfamily)
MTPGPIELMAQARAGQAEALGELCALYRNYLRIMAQAGLGPKLRHHVDLSDVVQETLVEVVRQFPRFTGETEGALTGWLRRLMSEKLADLGRYNGRAKRGGGVLPLALDAPREIGPMDDPGDYIEVRMADVLAVSQATPSEDASRRELVLRVADALRQMPRPEADVLLLYHAEGESFTAIGSRLGMSRKAVRRIWARGLKTLKHHVDPV